MLGDDPTVLADHDAIRIGLNFDARPRADGIGQKPAERLADAWEKVTLASSAGRAACREENGHDAGPFSSGGLRPPRGEAQRHHDARP